MQPTVEEEFEFSSYTPTRRASVPTLGSRDKQQVEQALIPQENGTPPIPGNVETTSASATSAMMASTVQQSDRQRASSMVSYQMIVFAFVGGKTFSITVDADFKSTAQRPHPIQ